MKSTITDIARETGLSVSTISKYLNQKPVRPENARLIEEAIHRMDYTPNPIAQGLRSKKARMAALVIPPLGNELWGRIIYPIEDVLRAHGYMTVVCTASVDASKNNTGSSQPLLEFLSDNRINGVISIGGALPSSLSRRILADGVPVVCAGDCPSDLCTDFAASTDYDSSFQAANYLMDHGHSRLGFVAGSPSSRITKVRTQGFLDAVHAKGLEIPPAFRLLKDTDSESPFIPQAFRKMMEQTDRPTALFFSGYGSFLSCLSELAHQNFQIPEDLSILSFDNDKIFDTLTPKVTVIQENFQEIGQKAAALLLKRLSGNQEGFPKTCLIPTEFLEGDSVKKIL